MDTLQTETTPEEHQSVITDIRFRPNSTQFATASFDKSVRLWDAANVITFSSIYIMNIFTSMLVYSPQYLVNCWHVLYNIQLHMFASLIRDFAGIYLEKLSKYFFLKLFSRLLLHLTFTCNFCSLATVCKHIQGMLHIFYLWIFIPRRTTYSVFVIVQMKSDIGILAHSLVPEFPRW